VTWLELKLPPVVVFLLVLIAQYAAAKCLFFSIELPFSFAVFSVCFVLSGYFGLAGVYEFYKLKTTVDPHHPERANRIVDSGVFKLTRNPMYVGLLLLVIGYGYWLNNGLSLALIVAFVLYMNRFQIRVEERTLERLFGEAYCQYKQRVRRWL
jgi:protein-S-isoprenylcysteine O-methyltransferase Ste14